MNLPILDSLKAISSKFFKFWTIAPEQRKKVFLLAVTFLFLSACQALWRPLKTSIFAKMVGASCMPLARFYVLFYVFPLILFYSFLVDRLKRHQLIYCFTAFHAAGGFIFFYLLSSPFCGIGVAQNYFSRIVGWAFYFFMEGFSAFLVTTFWAFADSISTPEDARAHYGFLTIGSKVGGMVTAGTLYFFLGAAVESASSSQSTLPIIMICGSFLLLGAAGAIYFLVATISLEQLQGYESSSSEPVSTSAESVSVVGKILSSVRALFGGLFVIARVPYVLGITTLILLYEIVIVIFDFEILFAADKVHSTSLELTKYYALYYFAMHGIGFVISLLGTIPIQRAVDLKYALLVFPVITLAFVFASMYWQSAQLLLISVVVIKALNYALNHPTREALYIPTTKDIKYKSKAWTDAFGSRFAKMIGAFLTMLGSFFSVVSPFLFRCSICVCSIFAWICVTIGLAQSYDLAIKEGRLIGDLTDHDNHKDRV